jgi:ribosomal-protein-alanine N-acetyltransferase
MAVEVRPAKPSDADTLAQVGLEAWLKGIGPHVPSSVREQVKHENPFIPFIASMGAAIVVAVVDGQIAGLGACEHKDDLISDVWVAPSFEGRGAGSALVRALEAEIRGRGYRRARLEVLTENARASGLYAHMGYRPEWRAVRHDTILKLDLDKIGMSKLLSA